MSDDYLASPSTSGVITVNGASQTGSLEESDDRDWFAVTLAAGTNYQFAANGTTLADPYLSLFNAATTLLASDDDSGDGLDSWLGYTPTSSGTYYLEVRGYGGDTGTYTLTATPGTDDFADNTSTSGTAVIGNNGGTIDSEGDEDWFAISLTANRTYTIDLLGNQTGNGTLSDPVFRGIHDRNGTLIDGTTNDDYGDSLNSRVVFIPTTTGTYYLAAGAYGSFTGTYQLQVAQSAVLVDTPSTTSTTATLAVGSEVTDIIKTSGDRDWYRVDLTAGHTYIFEQTANTAASSPLADPFIRGIYNRSGTFISGTANDDYGTSLNSQVQFTPTTSGNYYVSASGYRNNTGSYILSLEELANTSDSVSASTSTAGRVTVGGQVAGAIDSAFENDWYRISLTAGQNYELSLRGADSGSGTLLDPLFVGVYNSSGVLITGTGNDDSQNSRDSQTFFRPTRTGTYYLAAGGYSDLTGTYTLAVDSATTTDLADNINTTGVVSAGGSVSGVIDNTEDVDWFRVNLQGGTTYRIQQLGADSNDGSLADPLLRGVYNGSGLAMDNSSNDDNGTNRNASVDIVAPTTGAYYIAASAYGGGEGSFLLSVSASNAVADTTAPTLSAFSFSGATDLAPRSNLTFNFNEAVQAGSGNIQIIGGGTTRTIAVGSSQVSFSGQTMTVNPASNLAANTSYRVSMDSGAVKDLSGNSYSGIQSADALSFSTGSNAATTRDSWTVMVYVDADNNLEQFALNDLNEMESVTLPSNINVVTQVDRIDGYDSSNGNWTDTRRGSISRDSNLNTVSSFANFTNLGELNAGDPANLTNFIDWAKTNNPADHYALILWDHGGGLNGVAWDDTNGGDNLSGNELTAAIANSDVTHFDLIGFDACLMGMLEVAWDLRSCSDVVVASEELIPGEGWAYDRWLSALPNNPNMTAIELGNAMVSTYAQEYQGQNDITLSSVRTSDLLALNTALNTFADSALTLASGNADWQVMRDAARDAYTFPNGDSLDYRDLGHFMEEVAANANATTLRNNANAVNRALGQAVMSEAGSVAPASGLSIYLPYGSTPVSGSYTQTSHSFLAASRWETYLASL